MREIKFRAWFKNGKFKVMEGQKCSMQEERTLLEFLQDVKDCADEHGYNFILMQYTGLKDKNGKEIYEGDIVEVDEGDIDKGIHKVEYCGESDYPAFDLEPSLGCDSNGLSHCMGADDVSIKVIGDIYSNPELIKESL